MKPIAAQDLNGTADALLFINTRADLLHSLCRSAQDTAAASNGTAEDDRSTVNRLFELLIVLEDEIDMLTAQIITAQDIHARESAAAAPPADPAQEGSRKKRQGA